YLRRSSFFVLPRLGHDTVELTHHTATRGMTTATLVFRSAAAKDGIENLFEIPPGVVAPPLCTSDFNWWAGSPGLNESAFGQMVVSQLDSFGNYYRNMGAF